MPFAPDRVGIVGATGFIGRALVADLIADGLGQPKLFGRSGGTVSGVPVEPLTLEPRSFSGLETVVHLAAITTSRADPKILQQTNVDLTVDVARAAAAAGVKRLVFLSSLHVHGKASPRPVAPTSPFREDNAYGRSKIAAENALRQVADESGLELSILRPPMVYGPGGRNSFALLARLVRTGLPLPLAGARGKRSFCSLANLVSSIRHAVDARLPLDPFIPADAEDFDTLGLIRAIAAAEGRSPRTWPMPRPLLEIPLTLVNRAEFAISLFEPLQVDRAHWAACGWRPRQSADDGVVAALSKTGDARPLALYVTNSTPYFISHRLALAREVARRGFRVAVAGGDVLQHRTLEPESILPLQIPGGRRGVDPMGDLGAGWAIGGHIRRQRAAVVHASGLKAIFLCALARARGPLPRVVCIVTGLGTTYINETVKVRVMRRAIESVIRPLLRRDQTRVVFQNTDDHAYFLARGLIRPETSLIIRGSGVDTGEFAVSPEPDGVPVVVFPARLLKSKGVLEFAAAAALVKAQGVAVRFVLVGNLDPSNPDALSAQELAAMAADGVVEVWGFRSDMVKVFANCHLVCMPSYREGLPKALIEAASVGRAIVTTDVPGCREIVVHGHNGLLVPVRSPEALAAAILELLRDPERRRAMGAAGRKMVESEFALDVVVARTADLYGAA